MNERKMLVIKAAHQLFTDKGFQNTSIQDILDYSGISKGTFYNYFSSKNELLITLFITVYKKLEKDLNELLIGQDPSDIEVFIKQIELQMKTNRANRLLTLFEEVLVLNDPDFKEFMKQGQFRMLRWLYNRFIDIFGESKKPYLLDCAIMFMGILHQNLKYQAIATQLNPSIHRVVRYSVERLVKMVDEVAVADDQLIQPQLLEIWLPDNQNTDLAFQQKLSHAVSELRKVSENNGQEKYTELLEFVHEELLHSKKPRRFLVESALLSLRAGLEFFEEKQLENLEQLVEAFFKRTEESGLS